MYLTFAVDEKKVAHNKFNNGISSIASDTNSVVRCYWAPEKTIFRNTLQPQLSPSQN